jgi:phosphoglycolate phosphatase
MKFRGILFDKDGTLIESDAVWVPLYRNVLMRLKGISAEQADELLALAGYDAVGKRVIGGTVIAGGTTRQLVDLWWPESTVDERLAVVNSIDETDMRSHDIKVTPVADLVPLLARLRAVGFRLGIATNDSENSANRHMQQLGIAGLLDAVIGSNSVAQAKPAGLMIAEFARRVGIATHEIIMVGDNHHDMDEAVNGGAGYRVAVLTGNSNHHDLAHLADVTLNHVGELPEHLEVLGVL